MAEKCEEVNVDLFIETIKSYPEIWNVCSQDFHDRQKRRNAWIGICKEFYDGFEKLKDKEKNETCNAYIRKWRNIRDNYKSCLRKKKSRQTEDFGKNCVHVRQLSFLEQCDATTETQSSIDVIEDKRSFMLKKESQVPLVHKRSNFPTPHSYDGSAKKRCRDNLNSLLNTFMNAPITISSALKLPEINPDMSFFESLLPAVSAFSEDQKLDFRCEVLNLVKKMRQSKSNASQPQSYLQSYESYLQSLPSDSLPKTAYYSNMAISRERIPDTSQPKPTRFSEYTSRHYSQRRKRNPTSNTTPCSSRPCTSLSSRTPSPVSHTDESTSSECKEGYTSGEDDDIDIYNLR